MVLSFAKRMENLGTETAFEVLAKAKALEKQGKHIIHVEIGEPDFDTPRNIKDAAVKAMNAGYTHYTPAAGIPEFREAI
ncbi:MAG: pyridoxal phosphate-dependent aminotransferase, partial [Candidatus Bathyarchaeia archaeon]